jgi:hypothetical protein
MEDMSMEFNMQNKSDLVRPKNIAMIVLCIVLSICAIGATIKYLFVNDELVATTNGPTTIMSGTPITATIKVNYGKPEYNPQIVQMYVDEYYEHRVVLVDGAIRITLLVDKNLIGTHRPVVDIEWISIELRYESNGWQNVSV